MSAPNNSLPRRTGDAVKIDGAYQHRALTEGPAVQRFWHRGKLDLINWAFPIAAGDRVLDIGCGSGVFADAMATSGANVVGIDANLDAVSYAKQTFQKPNLLFRDGLLDSLGFTANSFDKVTCLEVIEHVYEHQVAQLLADIARILVPGGRVLLTTPNYKGLWPVVEWAADRFSSVAKMDADQHVMHFDRALLRRFIQDAGLSVEMLRTHSTLAPFVAPLSWKAALQVEGLEKKVDLPFGNVLVAVATKPL